MIAFLKKREAARPAFINDRSNEDFFGMQPKLETEASPASAKDGSQRATAFRKGNTSPTFFHSSNTIQKKQSKEEEQEVQQKEEPDTTTSLIQQKCAACDGEEETIQKKETQPQKGLEQSLSNSKGKGASLPKSTQQEMNKGFGRDLGDVKIHTDQQAVEMNQQLGAKAFTNGNDIYFNKDQYNPSSQSGKQLLAHELTHTIQQQADTLSSTNRPIIQRQCLPSNMMQSVENNVMESRVVDFPQSLADEVISDSVANTLQSFQQISMQVSGPLNDEDTQTSRLVTHEIIVKAQYFINTETGKNHFAAARRTAGFTSIKRALAQRGHVSIVQSSTGGSLSSGRAVELGKGTPDDIRLFVQEAVNNGTIEQFARANGYIRDGEQLMVLPAWLIQVAVQHWMQETGVGVDCSGFVLQATHNARQALINHINDCNAMFMEMGLNFAYNVPDPTDINVRSAASFRGEPAVGTPLNLRPGDTWVVSEGGHIRVIIEVREVLKADATEAIEFVTAESSGGSTSPNPGPIRKTWQTHSLTELNPITNISGGGDSEGSFHRVE